ncbi:MAG: NTP transferase domain-containing protein [Planctomycetes bacterium]|jgi:NDP-sugar pyrophosphorylase family protein|nr:NTP transferase domain-containing protein [Planctomycetota bacterium]
MKPDMLMLAAGMGRRFGGLKQFAPVGPNGESILDYSLYDALRAGFGRFVFILRPEIEADFESFLAGKFDGQAEVVKVFQAMDDPPVGASAAERTKPWGTGHAVLAARDVIDKPFAVINADDFYGAEAHRLLADQLTRPTTDDVPHYGMVGFLLRETLSDHGPVSRGVCECDPQGRLQTVTERTTIERDGNGGQCLDASGQPLHIPGDTVVSMNCWGFTPEIMSELHARFEAFVADRGQNPTAEFFLPQVVTELIDEGKAKIDVAKTDSKWFGLTYPADRQAVVAALQALVNAGEYPETLWG